MQAQSSITGRLVPSDEIVHAQEEVVNRSNRVISGSAYRNGMYSGLELLRPLRSDPYKAKSPEANLDLEQIATHASQAVITTLLFSLLALGTFVLQLIFGVMSAGALQQAYSSGGSDGSSFWSGLSTVFGGLVFLIGFVGALCIAYEWIYLRWSNARRFLKQNYDPRVQRRFLTPLSDLFRQSILKPDPNQNVITFGGYSPFVGAGVQVSGWTLTIDRRTKSSDQDQAQAYPVAVSEAEFYQAIDAAIAKAGLPGLQASSLLLVNGYELDADGTVLGRVEAQPATFLREEQLWQLGQAGLRSGRRAYRLYRYVDVARDMTFSYYLRFYNVGAITFVEGSAHTLTAIDRRKYNLTGLLGESKVTRWLRTIGLAVLLTFFSIYVIVALLNIAVFVRSLWSWRTYDRRQRRAVRSQEEYNYGLEHTFRESVAAPFYQDYYGVQDLTMYWKSIEEALLSGLITFLNEKGIDTSKFEQSVSTIINQGVMVSGGKFTANQVAVGAGASSIMGAEPAQSPAKSVQSAVREAVGRVVPSTNS